MSIFTPWWRRRQKPKPSKSLNLVHVLSRHHHPWPATLPFLILFWNARSLELNRSPTFPHEVSSQQRSFLSWQSLLYFCLWERLVGLWLWIFMRQSSLSISQRCWGGNSCLQLMVGIGMCTRSGFRPFVAKFSLTVFLTLLVVRLLTKSKMFIQHSSHWNDPRVQY